MIIAGFSLNISGNTSLSGCIDQGYYSSCTGSSNKLYAKSYWNIDSTFNSTFNASESEENLGKLIGECYLDPLCFKLPIPENKS